MPLHARVSLRIYLQLFEINQANLLEIEIENDELNITHDIVSFVCLLESFSLQLINILTDISG